MNAWIFVLLATGSCASGVDSSDRALPIRRFEAMTLVAMVDNVAQLRVQVELEASLTPSAEVWYSKEKGWNTDVWEFFEILAPSPTGSGIVGRFAVNRYTADVCEFTSDEFVTDEHVLVLQHLFRETHPLSQAQFESFRAASLRTDEMQGCVLRVTEADQRN